MHVHICVHTRVYLNIYAHDHVYVFICVNMCVPVYMCTNGLKELCKQETSVCGNPCLDT